MDKDTLERMADIAHVRLDEQEIKQISKELGLLMEHFDKLSEVEIESVLPTVHPITDKNVLREDVVWKSLPIEEVLKNAPDKNDRFFRVPRIIEE
ncbi:MAG: Asp-tRNA(Asn)/Glu-tRNA(Gln) amidotransferase subunit GatC [Thermoanaerobacteraceae bacterium]|nr:Asp-tRNA(Asn)/Glu-tRNA(Gln) amidotransferase subunit GatC [Thermoanaerobacteraceae bacterium]